MVTNLEIFKVSNCPCRYLIRIIFLGPTPTGPTPHNLNLGVRGSPSRPPLSGPSKLLWRRRPSEAHSITIGSLHVQIIIISEYSAEENSLHINWKGTSVGMAIQAANMLKWMPRMYNRLVNRHSLHSPLTSRTRISCLLKQYSQHSLDSSQMTKTRFT